MQDSSGPKLPSFSDIVSSGSEPSIRDLANIAYVYNKLSTPTLHPSAPKKHEEPVYISNPLAVNNSISSYEGRNMVINTQGQSSGEPRQNLLHQMNRLSDRESVNEITIHQVSSECPNQSDSHERVFTDATSESDIQNVNVATNQAKSHLFAVKYNLSCGNCERRFSMKDELYKHVCPQKQEPSVLYECQECKTLFPSLINLAQHMMVHEQHVVVTGPESSPQLTRIGYMCNFCDKVLSSKGSLAKHQELHKGLKPYECSFCGKSFSLKGNRDKHQLIHSGNRPFQCMLCSKTFTLKGNLQQHELTHSDTKLFKCTICERDFTLKGNLDKHVKRHIVGMVKPRSPMSRERKRKRSNMVEMHVEVDDSVGEQLGTRIGAGVELGHAEGVAEIAEGRRLTVVESRDVDINFGVVSQECNLEPAAKMRNNNDDSHVAQPGRGVLQVRLEDKFKTVDGRDQTCEENLEVC